MNWFYWMNCLRRCQHNILCMSFLAKKKVSLLRIGKIWVSLFTPLWTKWTHCQGNTKTHAFLLHSHNHDTYTTIHIYMRKQSQHNNNEQTHFFRKIYLSHFIRKGCERVAKGLCVRSELETEQTATYWPPVPLSSAALLSRSAGLLNRVSWGPIAFCWVLVLPTASYLQLDCFQLTEPVCRTG